MRRSLLVRGVGVGRWIGMRFLGFVCFHLFLLDFTVVSSPDDALSKTEPGMWTVYCCYLELVKEQTLGVKASHSDKVLKACQVTLYSLFLPLSQFTLEGKSGRSLEYHGSYLLSMSSYGRCNTK